MATPFPRWPPSFRELDYQALTLPNGGPSGVRTEGVTDEFHRRCSRQSSLVLHPLSARRAVIS